MTSITLPDATTTIAAIANYSGSFFTEYLPIIYVVLGLVLAALGIKWLQRTGNKFFNKVFGGGRRSGRRRSRR